MTYTDHLRKDEQDFYNVVMTGNDLMLPNSDARVLLHGVETTRKVAHGIRRIGVAGLDLAAPMTIGLAYSQRSQTFNVNRVGLVTDGNNRPLSLTRTKSGFKTQDLQPRQGLTSVLPSSDIDRVLFDLELPQSPPVDDPEEYERWMNGLRSYGTAWRTKEKSTLRSGRVGQLSAALVAIRQVELFPNHELASIRGVEYSITDRTHPDITTKQTSFVGEHLNSSVDEFHAFEERTDHFKNGQVRRYDRRPVVLTPLVREKWLERLIDEETGVPHTID